MVMISQKFTANLRTGAKASMQPRALGFASALALVSHFKQLMAAEGYDIDSRQMLTCGNYTAAQLALGHTSTTQALRLCAMRVFALMQT